MSAINQEPALLDRCAHLRGDDAALNAALKSGVILEIYKGRVRADEKSLVYRSLNEFLTSNGLTPIKPVDSVIASNAGESRATSGGFSHQFDGVDLFFLGISPATEKAYFAADVTRLAVANSSKIIDDEFKGARDIAPALSGIDIEVALTGVALANWHHAHPRCAQCGQATRIDQAGFVRVCDSDGAQHHPRTDGAVIVLVKDRSDRILLGHNPNWPAKRFSTFAGFVEPGETFEQCVAREVREESSVSVSEIAYLGSQPWPFPASIMISFEAVTDSPDDAKPDGVEITEVRWFTRDELFAAAESGEVLLPPKMAVARKMINRWFQQGSSQTLRGGETWR